MNQQVFYDPQRKRWKRLRRIIDLLALLGMLLGSVFVVGLVRMKPLPELFLQAQKRNYRALIAPSASSFRLRRSAHRRTDIKPGDVPLNSGEGLRAAYYVEDDPASYSSLKQHISQVDLLFPEWLHVITPDGKLNAYAADNSPYAVIDHGTVRPVDREAKVARTIAANHVNLDIFPLVNNYDPRKGLWVPEIAAFLSNEAARTSFVQQVHAFLAANPTYRGLSVDFEEIPTASQPAFKALIAALYDDLHPRNLRLYVNTPVGDDDWDLKFMADHSDGLLLMNYDEHQDGSSPGPIASQDWFLDNLKEVLKTVPKEKIICSLGSYGYDWTTSLPPEPAGGKKPIGKKKTPPEKVLSAQYIS
ncbi:MAG TPA: glycosyl hydrolase family 18 protein, partial [Edaphobacter sp.]|nr:glycosyl hydrolase family 18 protein [Edaphobacter sp.]